MGPAAGVRYQYLTTCTRSTERPETFGGLLSSAGGPEVSPEIPLVAYSPVVS